MNNQNFHSKRKNPTEIMQEFADVVEGIYTESKKGVPYVVISLEKIDISVCYFGKTDIYRLFYPYPCDRDEQKRKDFSSARDAADYIDKLKSGEEQLP